MSYVQHSGASAESLDMKVSLAKVRMDRRDYGAEIPGLSWTCCEHELCVNHGRVPGSAGWGGTDSFHCICTWLHEGQGLPLLEWTEHTGITVRFQVSEKKKILILYFH